MDFKPAGGNIDLTTWEFNAEEVTVSVKGMIGEIINDTLRQTFEDDPPWLTLADESTTDPLTLLLLLPLGPSDVESPQFEISLRELLLGEISDDVTGAGQMNDTERNRWLDIAKALSRLAADIEAEVEKRKS